MSVPTSDEIREQVLDKAMDYAGGIRGEDEDKLFGAELHIEGWDFIDLCEDIEGAYGIDLKPFFENRQPYQGWFIWKRKVARDVSPRQLADQVAQMVGRL